MAGQENARSRLRRDRKEWGLCTSCGGKRDREDLLTCEACRKKGRKKNEGRYQSNKAYYNAYCAAYYHKRRQMGMCTRCGKRPAMENRRLCDVCGEKTRLEDAMRRKASKDRRR